jgi:hypothetical protein
VVPVTILHPLSDLNCSEGAGGKGDDVTSAAAIAELVGFFEQLFCVEVFLVCLMRQASVGCGCDESTLSPEFWRSFICSRDGWISTEPQTDT